MYKNRNRNPLLVFNSKMEVGSNHYVGTDRGLDSIAEDSIRLPANHHHLQRLALTSGKQNPPIPHRWQHQNSGIKLRGQRQSFPGWWVMTHQFENSWVKASDQPCDVNLTQGKTCRSIYGKNEWLVRQSKREVVITFI